MVNGGYPQVTHWMPLPEPPKVESKCMGCVKVRELFDELGLAIENQGWHCPKCGEKLG